MQWTSAVFLLLGLLPVSSIHGQGIAINDTGAPPNPHALLDVDGSTHDRGVLLPRMTTAERTAIAGLGAADEGLTVYDSTSKSYWFWDGAQWVQLGGGGAGWGLTGNAGTVMGTHFIGTTDANPFEIWTNGQRRVRITTQGQIETLNTGESVFIGEGAGLNDDLSGNGNVLIGYHAGIQNTTGSANTVVGASAMSTSTTSWYNTAIGHSSLAQNTSGSSNTAVGMSSLYSNTTGYNNTAVGSGALYMNNTGTQNTAVGGSSLTHNDGGFNNTAAGAQALRYNVTGISNTAHGVLALQNNVAGSNATAIGALAMRFANDQTTSYVNSNVAVGYEALRGSPTPSSNTGLWNTAIGYQSLVDCTSGYYNTGVGSRSLRSVQSGFENSALGAFSLQMNTTGYFNTALGSGSLFSNTIGYYNVAVGASSLTSLVNGWNNVAIGAVALSLADGSQGNVAIGADALRDMVQGDGNIAIGAFAMEEHQTGGNNIAIGGGALGDNYTGTGNVAIGTGAGYGQQVSDKLFIQMGPGTAPLIYGDFDTDFVRINDNLGVGCSTFGGGTKVLAIEAGIAPNAPIPNGGLIFAALDGGTYELRTMDGAGNVTSFSPHNFSLAPRSEPMAWSYWSENRSVGRRINVDMLRVVRLVERLSGERLVYEQNTDGTPISANEPGEGELERLRTELRKALEEIARLRERVGVLETR